MKSDCPYVYSTKMSLGDELQGCRKKGALRAGPLIQYVVVVKCIFLLKCDTVYKLLRKFTKYVQNMRKSKLLLRSLLNCSNVERAHRNRYRLVWQSINHIVYCVVPEHRYAVKNWQFTNLHLHYICRGVLFIRREGPLWREGRIWDNILKISLSDERGECGRHPFSKMTSLSDERGECGRHHVSKKTSLSDERGECGRHPFSKDESVITQETRNTVSNHYDNESC
jgi:hypothetical protein